MRFAVCVSLGLAVAAGIAVADDATENPWAAASEPSDGDAESIGGYSAGCVKGAATLPLDGTGFHVARPERKRHFGHPDLISFVTELGQNVHDAELGVVILGDLGQPRGGPAPSGHASHQSGLDADIWYWHPKWVEGKKRLSRKQRKRLSDPSIVSKKTKSTTTYWSPKVAAVLKLAATDARVARIFVNPVIKKELCTSLDEDDRAWLRKLRPWWGHSSHFHVRLHCPDGSDDCEAQGRIPKGDGCDQVDWWLDDKAQAEQRKRRKKYRKKVGARPELPARCAALVADEH